MSSQGLKVYARIRPLGARQQSDEVNVVQNGGSATLQARNVEFSLDGVFDHDSKQEDVYQAAAHEQVEALLGGYSAAIMAYGQTGSGKTHTLYGPDEVLSNSR